MDNYVDRADKVMRALSEEAQKSYGSKMVTTSQIRKFLTAVNRVNGKIDQFKMGINHLPPAGFQRIYRWKSNF